MMEAEPVPEQRLQRIEGITDRLEEVATDLGRARKWMKVIGTVLVLDVVLSALVGYVTLRDYRFQGCMQHWAEDFTARTKSLTGLTTALHAAELTLDEAMARMALDNAQGVDPHTPIPPVDVLRQDYRRLTAAVTDYDRAVTNYTRSLRVTPVPEAPNCKTLF